MILNLGSHRLFTGFVYCIVLVLWVLLNRPAKVCAQDPKVLRSIHVGGRGAEAIAFFGEGKRMVSAGWEYTAGGGDQDFDSWKQGKARGVVRLWNTENGQAVAAFKGACGAIFDVAVSPDNTLIATAGRVENSRRRGEVKIWDVKSQAEKLTLKGHRGNGKFGVVFPGWSLVGGDRSGRMGADLERQ